MDEFGIRGIALSCSQGVPEVPIADTRNLKSDSYLVLHSQLDNCHFSTPTVLLPCISISKLYLLFTYPRAAVLTTI
jgi:hypothetical protein